jgi:hypothetical protein
MDWIDLQIGLYVTACVVCGLLIGLAGLWLLGKALRALGLGGD